MSKKRRCFHIGYYLKPKTKGAYPTQCIMWDITGRAALTKLLESNKKTLEDLAELQILEELESGAYRQIYTDAYPVFLDEENNEKNKLPVVIPSSPEKPLTVVTAPDAYEEEDKPSKEPTYVLVLYSVSKDEIPHVNQEVKNASG